MFHCPICPIGITVIDPSCTSRPTEANVPPMRQVWMNPA